MDEVTSSLYMSIFIIVILMDIVKLQGIQEILKVFYKVNTMKVTDLREVI